MPSVLMVSAGIFLLIVCGTQLCLTAPVDDPADDIFKDAETPAQDYDDSNNPAAENVSPNVTTVTMATSTSKTTVTVTMANTNGTSNITNATEKLSQDTSTSTVPSANSNGTSIQQDVASSDAENTTGTTITNGPDVKPADDVDEYHFWWSNSTWMSIAVPVVVGLGSAVLLIAWICCLRWCCCRHRYRSPPYKAKVKVDKGASKKTLREDFRQLRQRDRMKLLAESSDEEF